MAGLMADGGTNGVQRAGDGAVCGAVLELMVVRWWG